MLHQIGYQQHGPVRPIIHRIAMNEIFVPYAIPDPTWIWRSALDVGEYNLGQLAEPLAAGIDVPDNAVSSTSLQEVIWDRATAPSTFPTL